MTSEEDAEFLARRETEERAIADATSDPMIKGIHEVLAERYADRGSTLAGNVDDNGTDAAKAAPPIVATVDGGVTISAGAGAATSSSLAAERTSDIYLPERETPTEIGSAPIPKMRIVEAP